MACATFAFIDGLGGPEMLLIFVLVLVLFGGQKLPEFARGLGKTMREFKKAASGVEEEFKRALEEDERKQNAAALPAPAATTSPTPEETTPSPHDDYHAHHHEGGPGTDPYSSPDDYNYTEPVPSPTGTEQIDPTKKDAAANPPDAATPSPVGSSPAPATSESPPPVSAPEPKTS